MQSVIEKLQQKQKKARTADVRSGDTVKVHQRIREGSKERTQVFQGLVIRVDRKNSATARITVRRATGGVGVEKSFLLHSPFVEKVEIVKRSKVRRNYLSYMRARTGKSARLSSVAFDKDTVNVAEEPQAEPEAEKTESTKNTEASDADESKDAETNSAEKEVPEAK